MNVADRIKRLRELFGITANDLAKITGIHPVSIRKYETNLGILIEKAVKDIQ